MFRFLPLIPIAALACSNQEERALEYAEATCQLYEDCEVLGVMGDFSTLEECIVEVEQDLMPEAGCSRVQTRLHENCIEGILSMTCDDLYEDRWPSACDEMCD